ARREGRAIRALVGHRSEPARLWEVETPRCPCQGRLQLSALERAHARKSRDLRLPRAVCEIARYPSEGCVDRVRAEGQDLLVPRKNPLRLGAALRGDALGVGGHVELRSEEHTSELQSLRHLVC